MTHLLHQNVPQLALQILYLVQHGDSSSTNFIVYGAMLFSLISILSNTLAFCTQREIAKATGRVSVQFDITSTSKGVINRKQNRNRYKEIQRELAAILEIDKSLIRISRPMPIMDGLRMNMNIYINHTKAIDMDIGKLLRNHVGGGHVAGIVKEAWELQDDPIISNLNVQRIASKDRKNQTVQLSVPANSASLPINNASNVSPIHVVDAEGISVDSILTPDFRQTQSEISVVEGNATNTLTMQS